MNLIPWTEIESFHNIRKFIKAYPENLHGNPIVKYRAKCKLHGTNAAVQVHTNGTILAQSRTQLLIDGADNAGFAKWVNEHKSDWSHAQPGYIYFGEWIGRGVQSGVACSEIPRKSLAIFAARPIAGEGDDLLNYMVSDPDKLSYLVGSIPDTYVLPWYQDKVYSIDWSASTETLANIVDSINQDVAVVEINDPWVETTFGIKGTGEGLVFYPESDEHRGYVNFTNLVFKAKGEKHKNIKTAAPAQVSASSATDINHFVDMVLTNARLEQGAVAVAGNLTFDMKLLDNFLKWIATDVQKETQDELEASGLEWKQVSKPINDRARNWYIEKGKTL